MAPRSDGATEYSRLNISFIGEAERYIGMPVDKPIYLNATLFETVLAAFKEQSPVSPRVLYPIQESD